jgi:hypothetical protein
MRRAASVVGVIALLSAVSLTGCGDGEGITTGSESVSAPPTDSAESCTITTAALGAVVALVTKGKELEEIGQAVSSKFGGDVLSSACQLAVETFITDRGAEVPLTLKDPLGQISLQASLTRIRRSLNSPPPEPAPFNDPCFDYEDQFFQNLCLSEIISPPSS